MPHEFEYVFPGVRGIQAKREYFVSMCPLKLIPKIFLFDEDELLPEVRAQRHLNKARVPEMARYILDNPEDYVFSALTASIDVAVDFEPLGEGGDASRLGLLHIPMTAKFIVNDGQHRRAAIEMALSERADVADETIAIVFFLDRGLKRCQQMFADLNRHAIRPSKSLGVLYDYRDELAIVSKLVAFKSKVFHGLIEMEKSTLSLRSRKLFTLSAIYYANKALLEGMHDGRSCDELAKLSTSYWEAIGSHVPDWQAVREGKMLASEVRQQCIHSHGIVLHALGQVGNFLLHRERHWKRVLRKLRSIDWSRSNAALWEGRAMIGGRVSKAARNVTLTTNAIKTHLGLELSPEEIRVEDARQRAITENC